jgi:hypothetical protein
MTRKLAVILSIIAVIVVLTVVFGHNQITSGFSAGWNSHWQHR